MRKQRLSELLLAVCLLGGLCGAHTLALAAAKSDQAQASSAKAAASDTAGDTFDFFSDKNRDG
jgi:hypothetical protein